MDLYTSTYNYRGEDRLDITVKGNAPFGKHFAPTWKMVKKYRSGNMTQKNYERRYKKILNNVPKRVWKKLFKKDRVTIVCFCKSNSFCHRFLLAKRLTSLGANYKGEINLKPIEYNLFGIQK